MSNPEEKAQISNRIKQSLIKALPPEMTATDANEVLTEIFSEVFGSNVGVKVVTHRPRVDDRLAYIAGLEDVEKLRGAIRSAYAKRGKATTEEQDSRYGDEIEAARDRLAEINAMIDESEDPLHMALLLGETPDGIVQRIVTSFDDLEARYTRWLKYIRMTKKQAKEYMARIPELHIPGELMDLFNNLEEPEKYINIYKSRVLRKDQRVIHLSKVLNFMAIYTPSYVEENVVLNDGRGIYKKEEAKRHAREKKRASKG